MKLNFDKFKLDKLKFDKLKLDKDKLNKILPFLLCVLIAFLVWTFVMYIDTPEYVHEFSDIPVYIKDVPAHFKGFEIKLGEDKVSAEFYGTNIALAKCDSGSVYGVVNLNGFTEPGSYQANVIFYYPTGATLDCLDSVKVPVTIVAPTVYTKYFAEIPVKLEHERGKTDLILEKYNVSPVQSTVDAVITSLDEELLSLPQDKIVAYFDISDLNIIGTGIYNSVKLRFVCEDLEISEDAGIYVSVQVTEKE